MFPEYLIYGMSPEEYWEGDPNLAKAYREAYELKKDTRNYEMWLQGMYIYEGVAVAVAQIVAGDKRSKYPQEPYKIRQDTESEKKAKAEKERQKFIANMNAFESAWKRQHGK